MNAPFTSPTTSPAGAELGTLAKSVNAPPSNPSDRARSNRAEAFRLQRLAAQILGRERVGKCLWSVADLASQVRVLRRETRARFEGLQTCGSVWMCPVCSVRISEGRRRELNDALASARRLGLGVLLLTLTARHTSTDSLPDLLEALKGAKKRWHNSRTYKGYKPLIRGLITATELTHGGHGWHPHFHLLMFVEPMDIVAYAAFASDLSAQWLTSLEASGLTGELPYAFDLQRGDAAGDYVGKWGAAEELTLHHHKAGPNAKSKGRHPFAILRDAEHCRHSRALFFDYAKAFKGRRQLQWTPGLRDLLGVSDTSDEQLAADPPTNADEWLGSISRSDWPTVRHKGRARILEACETLPPLAPLQPVWDALEAAPDIEH